MKKVFTTSYEKYGTQIITIEISASSDNRLFLITVATKIPAHPHNNHEMTYSFKMSLDGVPRWISNDQIPPADAIKNLFIDQVPGFNHALTDKRRNDETQVFLAESRKQQATKVISPEEMSEMRAAFGRGTTVVNVITGRRTRL